MYNWVFIKYAPACVSFTMQWCRYIFVVPSFLSSDFDGSLQKLGVSKNQGFYCNNKCTTCFGQVSRMHVWCIQFLLLPSLDTVEPVLKDHPISQKYVVSWQVVSGDRFSYIEMLVLLPKMCCLSRQVVSHGSGRSRQVSLYILSFYYLSRVDIKRPKSRVLTFKSTLNIVTGLGRPCFWCNRIYQ